MLGATAQVWTLLVALSAGLDVPSTAVPAPPALRVDVSGCPDEIAVNLPALASLEIDVLLRERGPNQGPPDSVAVRCTESTAHIEVTLAGARRTSTMELGVLAADHRARAIALATAELVHSLSSPAAPGSAVNPPPSATAGKPRPASETTPEAAALGATVTAERSAADSSSRRSARRPAVLIGALAEWLGKPRATLIGARIAFHRPVSAVLIPTLSVDGSFGGFASNSGRVSARTLGAAAHLYAGATIGPFRFDAGPGVRIAWLWLRGEAATTAVEGRALSAAWGGPEVRARVAYGPFRAPLVALELGVGFITRPVRGLLDGTAVAFSLDGPWASACLQAGIEW